MALDFKGAHFPPEVMLLGGRWYVAYPLSTRHVEELLLERGGHVDHAPVSRWVIKYSPPWEEALHRRKRPVWLRWRRDETDVAILCRTHGDKSNHASEEVCSMSQPTTRKYPAAFKERAVKLAVESEQPIAQTARDLGVNENTLHTWIGKYHRVERQEKEVHDEHLYEELKRLRKENARLKEERDILKKAAAYFAQQLP
jgi:transposase